MGPYVGYAGIVRQRLLVLALLGTACVPTTSSTSGDQPAVGDDAVDGQFTFVVDSFQCGETEVKNGIFTQEANGEFCLLDLTVTNTGDQGRDFLAGAQGLFSYGGGRLAPSNEATILVNADVVNEEINPGLSIEATVIFDIADPAEIEFAHLKDAPLSQGVKVRLGLERG